MEISPGWFIPASTTTFWWRLGSPRSKVTGTPSVLLRLPSVAWVSGEPSNTFKRSFVEVFPQLPVIPRTGILQVSRYRVAKVCNAFQESSTLN